MSPSHSGVVRLRIAKRDLVRKILSYSKLACSYSCFESEAKKNPVKETIKTIFSIKWYLPGKAIMHFMMPHNNIGFSTEGCQDMATEIWLPHCCLKPLTTEPPWISARILYWLKVQSMHYIFVPRGMGLSSFKFPWWAPKECGTAVQGHPRSLIFVAIDSVYETSY